MACREGLELYRVRSRFRSNIHEAQRVLQLPVVVNAGLGYDKCTAGVHLAALSVLQLYCRKTGLTGAPSRYFSQPSSTARRNTARLDSAASHVRATSSIVWLQFGAR